MQTLINLLVWLFDTSSSTAVVVTTCWTQRRLILLLAKARFCQKPAACADSLLKTSRLSHQSSRYGRTRGYFSRAWNRHVRPEQQKARDQSTTLAGSRRNRVFLCHRSVHAAILWIGIVVQLIQAWRSSVTYFPE